MISVSASNTRLTLFLSRSVPFAISAMTCAFVSLFPAISFAPVQNPEFDAVSRPRRLGTAKLPSRPRLATDNRLLLAFQAENGRPHALIELFFRGTVTRGRALGMESGVSHTAR